MDKTFTNVEAATKFWGMTAEAAEIQILKLYGEGTINMITSNPADFTAEEVNAGIEHPENGNWCYSFKNI